MKRTELSRSEPPSSNMAWIALAVSLFICIPFMGLLSISLGIIALGKIRRSEGQMGGRKIAFTAIGVGVLSSLGWVLAANIVHPWAMDHYRVQMGLALEETFEGIQDRRDLLKLQVFSEEARSFSKDDVEIMSDQIQSACGSFEEAFVWRLGDPQGSWNAQRWPVGFTLVFENTDVEGDAVFVISSGKGLLSDVKLEEFEIRVPSLGTLTFPPRYDDEEEQIGQGDSTDE